LLTSGSLRAVVVSDHAQTGGANMRADLLLRGAEVLEADALNPEGIKFDLGTWAADARINLVNGYLDPTTKKYKYKDNEIVPVNCGTQACAFGLFALSEAFKEEGLGYKIIGGTLRPMLKKGDGEFFDWDAVNLLFDLDDGQSQRLFSAANYDQDQRQGATGELAVAARIRQLIANI